MGKYRVKERVAVLKGNKVTVYEPSDESINLDDESVKDFGERVEAVGQVPADTPDTQAAKSSHGSRAKAKEE